MMVYCRLYWTLWMLSCFGQYLCQDLQFPEPANGAVGESVVLAPDNPPSTSEKALWFFGSATIIIITPGETKVNPPYEDRVSVDTNTFALVLQKLRLDDSGIYKLTVTSGFETFTGETSLQVFRKISNVSLIGPEEPLIAGNSTANITSEGTGIITSVEWMKDNSSLSPSNRTIFSPDSRSVSISPVQRSDSGEYQCTYRNPVSSETAKLSLIINYGPEVVSIVGPEVVDLGVRVSLSCSANSEPSASFSWTFNGTNTSVTTDTFTIEETDLTHSGDYECTASNNVTKRSDARRHALLVKDGRGGGLTTGAIVGIVIGVLVAVAGICFLIVYLTKTKKIPMLLNKEQKETSSGGAAQSRQEPDSNYEEVIDIQKTRTDGPVPVKRSESTIYENYSYEENVYENFLTDESSIMMVYCRLYWTLWMLSCFGQYLCQDLQFPEPANGAVGESVVLAPDNPPSTSDITLWFFGSATIIIITPGETTVNPAYEDRVNFDINTFALVLQKLTLNDSGIYKLTVTSGFQTLTGETSLKVFEKISNVILIRPEELLIEGDSTANITSEGTGIITSVEWMKDNSPLSPSNRIIFSPDSRSVSISPVQRSDSGEYQCTYRNPVSSETARLSLIINYGPEAVSIVGPEVVDLGVRVSLSCSANSEPFTSFSWKFNATNTSVTTDTFTIDETDFTHSGDYNCTVWNGVTKRSDSQSHALLVKVGGDGGGGGEGGGGGGGGGGLTTGAIVGIVIGILVAVAGICGLIVYLTKTKKIPNLSLHRNGRASGAAEQSRQEPELNYADISHFQKAGGERMILGNASESSTEYAEVKSGAKSKAPPPPYGSQVSNPPLRSPEMTVPVKQEAADSDETCSVY
ncbi:cell adhesion molecule CEACAM5-like [Siphateles boraxobius]|uniref:cell adhesion molecule CEACAM5-like n=1 Tax=Siphateles boraxobius TaxID=180520 RepID=UPI004062CE08